MSRHAGRTFFEALILLALALFALTLIEVATTGSRDSSRVLVNNSQVRGIHHSLVLYAAGNGGFYPGLTATGADGKLGVEDRLYALLDSNYFTGDYVIHPAETRPAWTTGTLTSNQYSYAMLQLPSAPGSAPVPGSGRRNEWSATANPAAVVLGDRNINAAGAAPASNLSGTAVQRTGRGMGCSCTTKRYPKTWVGHVAYNSGATAFLTSATLATAYTTTPPAGVTAFPADELFASAGPDDCLLIHSGNAP